MSKIIKKINKSPRPPISNGVKIFRKIQLLILFLIIPLVSSAATIGGGTFKEIIYSLVVFINKFIIPTLVGFALLVFFWGVANFIRSAGNPEAIEEGKKKMLYGILGLFVIVGVWGLIGILRNTFGV